MTTGQDNSTRLSRRHILRSTALLAVTVSAADACSWTTKEPEPPKPNPDDELRRRVADTERDILDLYSAVLIRHPGLFERLSPFVTRHLAHLQALEPPAPAPTGSPAATSGGGIASISPTPTPAPLLPVPTPTSTAPETPEDAVAALREAERRNSQTQIALCPAALEPGLARLLASISACEAAHTVLLAGRP